MHDSSKANAQWRSATRGIATPVTLVQIQGRASILHLGVQGIRIVLIREGEQRTTAIDLGLATGFAGAAGGAKCSGVSIYRLLLG